MATIEKEVTSNGNGYKVIGTRPIRHDGAEKVTGQAKYSADVTLPGTLYGKYLRSPHAHARILSIDTSKAESLEGVRAVVTSADMSAVADKISEMGESAMNLRHLSNNILAADKALYHGHAIAAVAAINPHIAEEAVKLIDVEYEVLTPVMDVLEAMADDAPLLHDHLRTDRFGQSGDKPTNIGNHLQHKQGDIEKGFAEADLVMERTYRTAMVHQGYIEPHASTVLVKPDGHIDVWTSSQGPFDIRKQVATMMMVPEGDVTVHTMEIGGGFGGKFTAYTDVPAALLSKKAGHRPVKMAMTRTEVLRASGPTSGSVIEVKVGVKKDGTITAAQAKLMYESGAFPGSPVGAGAACIYAPYRIPNLEIDGFDIVNNRPKTSAYRAPGATNAEYASEALFDEIAEKLEMDPLEFRRINAAVEGDRRPDGPIHPRIGYMETVEAAVNHPHYKAPLDGKHQGRGVASGFWFNGAGPSSVYATVDQEGMVKLLEGSTDIGGTRASGAMMLAETMGLKAEDINPQVVDTDSIGFTSGTGGSSVTHKLGTAVHQLGQKLIANMTEQLIDIWDVKEVDYTDGVFSANGESATFKEAAGLIHKGGSPISEGLSVRSTGAGAGFATHIVDVEVDTETGKVEILRYTAVQDVGKAIHPSYVEGQIQGGVVQGIGWALNEEYFYSEDGHLLNSSLLDYRMPTALDLPMIDTVLVEVPNPGHPYGVRGVGEVPIVPPVAAIANAIYNATGKRFYDIPMSPPKVAMRLLEE
ncbi:MAG: xanthine dehydrogenase family protein molybdopterin-binding subunit [Chloroflexota bacterium]